MRLGPGPQITAVLSLWADDVATAIDVVRRLDPTVHAWAVTEREPLPPPPRVDGERTDALANFAFLRRPESMPHDEWLADWLERHTQVRSEEHTSELQSLMRISYAVFCLKKKKRREDKN